MYVNTPIDMEEAITENDLVILEVKYGFVFPKSLREHYLAYNGGFLEKSCFTDKDGDDFIFEGFSDVSDLDSTLGLIRDPYILPLWLIPFGHVPGGDLFCMSIRDADTGSIHYWSHEFDYGDVPEEQVTYLSDSLADFINKMGMERTGA